MASRSEGMKNRADTSLARGMAQGGPGAEPSWGAMQRESRRRAQQREAAINAKYRNDRENLVRNPGI